MSAANLLLVAGSGAASGPQGDSTDFFSTYVYEGTGSTQSIVNGIDLAGEGGMVFTKSRSNTEAPAVFDTVRGLGTLYTNLTIPESTDSLGLSYLSNGYSLNTAFTYCNGSGQDYVSWTFRKAPKFFDLALISHTNGAQSDYDASSLGEVGMVEVKQTNGTSDWFVWHKDLTAGNNLRLNATAAQSPTSAYVSVTGTTVSISSSAPTGDYIVYMYAHDPDTDNGIIQCGIFTGNTSVVLGFEPQDIEYKRIDSTGNWVHVDSIRGIVSGGNEQELYSNLSSAETTSSNDFITLTSTGFDTTNITGTYIFRAIRRPNRVPTSGTEVFAVDSAPNDTTRPQFNAGFPVDFAMLAETTSTDKWYDCFRLTQGNRLNSSSTAAESALATAKFDWNSGWFDASLGQNYYSWMFKRAPGFMDVVCDKGTGLAHTVSHNLASTVEFKIRKALNNTTQWECWHYALLANEKFVLNNNTAKSTDTNAWNNTLPTDSVFSVGTSTNTNANGVNYITLLFATLPGISKVFSYTGNGSSQTIPCGFASGARMILIIRVDSNGDRFLWDSARGIVAGNDPHLSLNTTATQVTTDDSVDPVNSGFIVNQNTATNINVNGASYIGLAIA